MPTHSYQFVKLNLKAGVKRFDITPLGEIKNIQSTIILNTTAESNTDSISIPMPPGHYSLPEFFDGKEKGPYVFVDNKSTILDSVDVQKDNLTLHFKFPLEKGQKVEIISQSDYALKDNESISLELEINP